MNQTGQASNSFSSTRVCCLARMIDSNRGRIFVWLALKQILICAELAFSKLFIILPVFTLANWANAFWPNGGIGNPRTPYTGIHDSPAITF